MLHTLGSKRRKQRISAKTRGSENRPRLSVFRSNKFMQAQIIDDKKHVTVVGISEKQLEIKTGNKVEKAKVLGNKLAELAKGKKISKVVFDKGPYRYHGRVKAFAEGVREGGLEF